jgi:hypothetical protein
MGGVEGIKAPGGQLWGGGGGGWGGVVTAGMPAQ